MDPVTQPAPLDVQELMEKANRQRQVNADVEKGRVESVSVEKGDDRLFRQTAKTLGKQDFLNLLVTQLRHQDPLNPSENTEFVAQLAQFSSLEGTQNISESIDKLAEKMERFVAGQEASAASVSNASVTSLIGKQVRAGTDSVRLGVSRSEPVSIHVRTEIPGAVVSLLDSAGDIVNVLRVDQAGESPIRWDGRRMDGQPAPAGVYNVRVTTADGSREVGYPFMEGRAEAVEFTNEGILITVAGQQVPMKDVVRVGAADQESEP